MKSLSLLCFVILSLTPSPRRCELRVRISPEWPAVPDPNSDRDGNNANNEQDEDNALTPEKEEEERRKAGERERAVYHQDVVGNSSTDTVVIDMEMPDGTIVTQLTDFRAQSQLMRVLIPGEEDLGQPTFQAFCFVSSYAGDVIPPEAVMKLRQKNPGTVRTADEDRGEVVQDSPLKVTHSQEGMARISSHLTSFCKDARDSVLSSEHELFNILANGNNINNGDESVKVGDVSHEAMKDSEHMPRCFSVEDRRHPCICSLRVCIDWYPCALKYCKNREGEGEHRCGIRTCRKCLTFRYPVKTRNLCMWDEI